MRTIILTIEIVKLYCAIVTIMNKTLTVLSFVLLTSAMVVMYASSFSLLASAQLTNQKNTSNATGDLSMFQGMEKSQLGNVIPGNQGTTFEGQQLANLSRNSSDPIEK